MQVYAWQFHCNHSNTLFQYWRVGFLVFITTLFSFTNHHIKVTHMFQLPMYTPYEWIKVWHKARQTTFGANFFFIYTKNTAILLQRDEPRRMCSSDTRATVLDWLVGDGELAQVMATHLRLKRRKIKVKPFVENTCANIQLPITTQD